MADLDEKLYGKLRFWRESVSRKKRCEPYMILKNQALEEIATKKPDDEVGLQAINGIGPKKLETYGVELLKLISDHKTNPDMEIESELVLNELEAKVLRVRLEGIKTSNPYQSVWLENDGKTFVLLLLGENINRFKKNDMLLIKGYSITRNGSLKFMKISKSGEISLIESTDSETIHNIQYILNPEELEPFTQNNSKIVKHGKVNYVKLRGLIVQPKSETDLRYTIYLLKDELIFILEVLNGFKKHYFKSTKLEKLEEVAEDEDKLYGIIYQTKNC